MISHKVYKKTKTLCHFRQNDFRMTSDPRLLFLPPALQRGRWAPTCRSCRWRCCRARRANSSNNGRDDPWWSMMIRFHLFPVSVSSFCFISVSICFQAQAIHEKERWQGMFSTLLWPCLVGTKLLITKQKKHVRKQFIIRMSKGCKLWCIQLWSLSTLWWLRVRISCQKMPNCISKTNTDILKYLEMMVGQLLSFRFCSRNPYTYIYIICIYKCINILSIQSLMVFSCLFMSFHVFSCLHRKVPFAVRLQHLDLRFLRQVAWDSVERVCWLSTGFLAF
jgi:hypothetical protein